MSNKDTITCAVTGTAGCAMGQTASAFRSVNGSRIGSRGCCNDWDNWDNNTRSNGYCDNCDSCNDCSNGTVFTRSRSNSCCNNCDPCNDCSNGTAFTRSRSNSCRNNCDSCNHCSADTASTIGSDCPCAVMDCGNCTPPGMVYETCHQVTNAFEAEQAIRSGTLFPELYKPLNGHCADNCGAQLCDGQAEAFAAWELRLYLNTHPCDRYALEMFKRYARCADQPNYAGAFAFDDSCPERWSWTDAPWPWEFNAACENNCGC